MNSSSEDEDAVVTESWGGDAPEGDINNIVTHEYTETTLPPDVELPIPDIGDFDDQADEVVTSSKPIEDDFDVIETEVELEEASGTAVTEPEDVNYWLDYNGTRLLTQIKWDRVLPEKSSDNVISYSSGGADVTITLTDGTREDYALLISDKAQLLNAKLDTEVISYSPSRINNMYEYDKYTLTYFKNEAQSEPIYAYYLISQVSEDMVYFVTISSENSIGSDSDIFGILEYNISKLD